MTAAEAPAVEFSLVVPVYGNEGTIARVVAVVRELASTLPGRLELVVVVDGSLDRSEELVRAELAAGGLDAQLLTHSRNFGSFAAIRSGLAVARGRWLAVMAADLQEPVELVQAFFAALAEDRADVTVGVRRSRQDPALVSLSSRASWGFYRRLIQKEMPPGGIDVFGCTAAVRDQLLALPERNSSLVGLLLWIGFRRLEIPYDRVARDDGRSGWTFRNRVHYLADSAYAFSSLPLRLLTWMGALGTGAALVGSAVVFVAWLAGTINVPGYTPLILSVLLFHSLTLFGLGILGAYLWRTFENTKQRPGSIVAHREVFR